MYKKGPPKSTEKNKISMYPEHGFSCLFILGLRCFHTPVLDFCRREEAEAECEELRAEAESQRRRADALDRLIKISEAQGGGGGARRSLFSSGASSKAKANGAWHFKTLFHVF